MQRGDAAYKAEKKMKDPSSVFSKFKEALVFRIQKGLGIDEQEKKNEESMELSL